MKSITVEIGRGRTHRIEFLVAGRPVKPNVLTEVMIRFGQYCLTIGNGLIWVGDKTAVDVRFGLIPGLIPGMAYTAHCTIFDFDNPEGLPADRFVLRAVAWPVCEV